ncbi:MAG: DUF5615 family PIN-like protein [Anaerolineales bacterium]|nr:MAG: DUF5615 family PIN-like protein [Anaerolineales bacterium]
MARPRLHLDADASIKAVYNALRERGHDVTHTPNDWILFDADDRAQLLGATAQGRVLFTFNIRDFQALAKQFPNHHGILLAAQSRWTINELIEALDRALTQTEDADWLGAVRWLNDFKE